MLEKHAILFKLSRSSVKKNWIPYRITLFIIPTCIYYKCESKYIDLFVSYAERQNYLIEP